MLGHQSNTPRGIPLVVKSWGQPLQPLWRGRLRDRIQKGLGAKGWSPESVVIPLVEKAGISLYRGPPYRVS